MKTIRVLLADDHEILREGLRLLLGQQPDMEVVGDVGDGREALRLASELTPDVVVMDIGMPELNGVEATRQLLSTCPDSKVLCLSVHGEATMVHAMLEAGASGYVLKSEAGQELLRAVRTVVGGESYLSPPIASQVVDHHVRGVPRTGAGAFETLTPREREVIQLIAEGHHTKRIAQRLDISPKTVLVHRKNIMDKLDIHSVAGLVRYALQGGVADL